MNIWNICTNIKSVASLVCCNALSFARLSRCRLSFARRKRAISRAMLCIDTEFNGCALLSFAAVLTSAALTAPFPMGKRPCGVPPYHPCRTTPSHSTVAPAAAPAAVAAALPLTLHLNLPLPCRHDCHPRLLSVQCSKHLQCSHPTNNLYLFKHFKGELILNFQKQNKH